MPILQIGESSGPMANGITYIVRPFMQPLNTLAHRLFHRDRIGPIIRRPGFVLVRGANKSAVLHARDIARMRAREKRIGPQFFVQLDESAALDHRVAERLIFRIRAVAPMDALGLAKSGHFLNPGNELLIGSRNAFHPRPKNWQTVPDLNSENNFLPAPFACAAPGFMLLIKRMNSSPDQRETHRDIDEPCLARSVVDTLDEEPSLEAVTIDPAHKKISVATLGRTDVEKLTQRLTEKFQSAQNVGREPRLFFVERQNGLRRLRLAVFRERDGKKSPSGTTATARPSRA